MIVVASPSLTLPIDALSRHVVVKDHCASLVPIAAAMQANLDLLLPLICIVAIVAIIAVVIQLSPSLLSLSPFIHLRRHCCCRSFGAVTTAATINKAADDAGAGPTTVVGGDAVAVSLAFNII